MKIQFKMARIKPTDPIMPILAGQGTRVYGTGIPLRLELAGRFMAAMLSNDELGNGDFRDLSKNCLQAADDLINEYNNQQKEGNHDIL